MSEQAEALAAIETYLAGFHGQHSAEVEARDMGVDPERARTAAAETLYMLATRGGHSPADVIADPRGAVRFAQEVDIDRQQTEEQATELYWSDDLP